MDGWLKFHRKVMQNPIFRDDLKAWHVFEVLLCICDKNTGSWSGGRYQLADLCGVNPNTLKDILVRLRRVGMVTTKTTSNYSTHTIYNWSRYQAPATSLVTTNVTNKTPTKHHSNKKLPTKVGSKNIEISTNVLGEKSPAKRDDEISRIFYEACKSLGLPILNHNTVRKKIADMKREANEEDLVLYLEFMRDKFAQIKIDYKPHVSSALDIYSKRVQIINAFKQAAAEQQPRVWRPATA